MSRGLAQASWRAMHEICCPGFGINGPFQGTETDADSHILTLGHLVFLRIQSATVPLYMFITVVSGMDLTCLSSNRWL